MTHTPIATVLVASLLLPGCIATKDLGVDTESDTAGDDGMSSSPTASGSETMAAVDTSASSSPTQGGGSTTTQETDGESDSESESQSGSATSSPTDSDGDTTDAVTDSDGESSTGFSETDGGEAQVQCENTGGTWDMISCGDYICGFAPDCDAVVPGCDCGVGNTFEMGEGCLPDPTCEPIEFACGPDLDCDAPAEYCDELVPGVPGPSSYMCVAVPDACEGDYSCECLEAAGVTGGADCVQGADLGITVTLFAP
ncbi:MAG: hypothetical protein AAGA54_32895 [Myxococcota bacterium]